jgi:hypothetical protein
VDSRLKTLIDQLIRTCGANSFEPELKDARQTYFAESGEISDDFPDYHARMEGFLEWYLFDRPLRPYSGSGQIPWRDGQKPLEAFLEHHAEGLDEADKRALGELANNQNSLFQVAKKPAETLVLKDLLSDEKFEVDALGSTRAFEKGDLLQGRVFDLEGTRYLSDSALFHPRGTARFVVKRAREVRKLLKGEMRPERQVFLDRLARIQLRAQRYRRVEPQRIYDEFY